MKKLFLLFVLWCQGSAAVEMISWDLSASSAEVSVQCENGNSPNLQSSSMLTLQSIDLVMGKQKFLDLSFLRDGSENQIDSKIIPVGKNTFMSMPLSDYDDNHPYFFISLKEDGTLGLHFADKNQELCGGGMLSFLISKI